MTDESFMPIIGIRRQINDGPWEDVEPERAARLGKLIAGVFNDEKEAAKGTPEANALDDQMTRAIEGKPNAKPIPDANDQAPIRRA